MRSPAGLPEMREWIADYSARQGMLVTHPDILVASDARQAIELVCRLLIEKGDSVVVTAPTAPRAIPIFRKFDVNFIEVGQDDEGIDVRELQRLLNSIRSVGRAPPRFIYTIPEYHNPTGVTMSLRRRQALLGMAARERILVVEDSPYREIHFAGSPPVPLKALDDNGLVLHIGTLPKVLARGSRVAWVLASPLFIARMTRLMSDGGASIRTQRVFLAFCRAGTLAPHLEHIRREYLVRRDVMAAALHELLPEISVTIPRGGHYLWLTLPIRIDGDELATRAAAAGVAVRGPGACFACPGHPRNHLRLAYSNAPVDEIVHGVRRLADAVRSMPEATPAKRT